MKAFCVTLNETPKTVKNSTSTNKLSQISWETSKVAYIDVTEPWNKNNAIALGKFDNIGLYFNLVKKIILSRGYCTEPSKIIIIVNPENLPIGRYFGFRHGVNICMGAHYLGGFIGNDESKRDWLKYWT